MARKRKKRRDPANKAFRPGQQTKRKKTNISGSFSERTGALINMMQAGTPESTRAILVNSTKISIEHTPQSTPKKKSVTTFLTPSKFVLSTPEKGPYARFANTPGGSKFLPSRFIECDDGAMTLYLPEDKVKSQELEIPDTPDAWINKSPIPKANMQGLLEVELTKEKITKVDALIRQRKKNGEAPRKITQTKLMGSIGAVTALRKAGIKTDDNNCVHYTHFVAFALLGDKAQAVENLGIGTRWSNAAMELVNPVIKELLYRKNNPVPSIYLSVIPEWVPGYENIRLLKNLTLIIRDGKENNYKHSAKIKFNMLSTAPVCLSDIQPVRKFILNKFSKNAPTPTIDAKQQNVCTTPTKPTPEVAISPYKNQKNASSTSSSPSESPYKPSIKGKFKVVQPLKRKLDFSDKALVLSSDEDPQVVMTPYFAHHKKQHTDLDAHDSPSSKAKQIKPLRKSKRRH